MMHSFLLIILPSLQYLPAVHRKSYLEILERGPIKMFGSLALLITTFSSSSSFSSLWLITN